MNPELLSRMQFALNIMFHYIFPPLSIGLGLILVIMEGIYMKTKNPLYRKMAKFWTRIFALTFSLGVATGLAMIFAFGTNWARLSHFMGDVFGSIVGAEGLFAFTAEAGFLALLLFGWNKISDRMHFLSTIIVCVAAHFSAFWIVIANSWMQTPAGYELVTDTNGLTKAVIENWWHVLNNPSALTRLGHVYLGTWLSGSFLVISISAFYLLKRKYMDFARASMKIALLVALVSVLLQGISGDSTATGVITHQPAKLAAMEGVFKTQESTPFQLWGVPDVENRTMKYNVEIPGVLSFLCYHNFTEAVTGLDQIPEDEWPPVPIVFQTYRVMIYLYMVMLFVVLLACFYWKRKKLENTRWLLWIMVFSVFCPIVANETGWMTAEIGRQPWVVYKLLRTSEAFSLNVPANYIIVTFILFSIAYLCLFALFLYLLNHKIKQGPDGLDDEADEMYQNYLKK
jgi:cytochrome d ubiquinol oxidase subunit I